MGTLNKVTDNTVPNDRLLRSDVTHATKGELRIKRTDDKTNQSRFS